MTRATEPTPSTEAPLTPERRLVPLWVVVLYPTGAHGTTTLDGLECSTCGVDLVVPVMHHGQSGVTDHPPTIEARGSLDDGLSEAWRAAEAALPEGWWLHDLGAWSFGDMAYRAEAASPGRQTDTSHSASAKRHGTRHWVTGPSAVAYGPTPAAALLSLAEKLRDR